MNTKVIGIGNRIMMDDAIGIRVLEELEEDGYIGKTNYYSF